MAVIGGTGGATLINVTAISDPTSTGYSAGVVSNNCYGENSLLVENSIVSGGKYDFELAEGCSGAVGIEVLYSNFDPAKVASASTGLTRGPGDQLEPPALVDPANGNFDDSRLLHPQRRQYGARPGLARPERRSADPGGDVDIGADELRLPPPPPATEESPPAPAPSTPPASTPPQLKHLGVTARRFSTTKPGKHARHRVKHSTILRYWLSEPAKVTFKVYRKVIGRKVSGKCSRWNKADRKHKHCLLRYRYVGLFKRAGEQGGNRARFAGRVRARHGKHVKLSPGTYRVKATATDADGGRSAPRSPGSGSCADSAFAIPRPPRMRSCRRDYVKFRSALAARDLWGAFEAARSLPGLLSLIDALELTLLAAEKAPTATFEECAARWLARVTVERRLSLSAMLRAGELLRTAPSVEPRSTFGQLADLTT